MPSRILREEILTSLLVNELDYPSEVFYRRLMSVVDDFGRYDAQPSLLKAKLYPQRLEKVREADISRWLAICEKAGLIALYVSDSKPYLELFRLGKPRADKSKYPPKPSLPATLSHVSTSENICAQMNTPVYGCAQVNTVVPYSYSYSYSDSHTADQPVEDENPPEKIIDNFSRFWNAYPKTDRKVDRAKCEKHWQAHNLDSQVATIAAGLRAWKQSETWTKDGGKYICGPHVWLNGRRWETEITVVPRVNEIGMPILTREEVLEKLGEVESCKVP